LSRLKILNPTNNKQVIINVIIIELQVLSQVLDVLENKWPLGQAQRHHLCNEPLLKEYLHASYLL
jgi:hypothetical protein